jgi:formate/nitrite transporter FocA (FNT family)
MLVYVVNMLALCLSRLAGGPSAKTSGVAMTCVAVTCCALGLVGSGFDYSVANAAAALEDPVIDAPDAMAWSNVIGNMFLASLASIVAGAAVVALSLWTAPNATMTAVPPQRQVYGEAD